MPRLCPYLPLIVTDAPNPLGTTPPGGNRRNRRRTAFPGRLESSDGLERPSYMALPSTLITPRPHPRPRNLAPHPPTSPPPPPPVTIPPLLWPGSGVVAGLVTEPRARPRVSKPAGETCGPRFGEVRRPAPSASGLNRLGRFRGRVVTRILCASPRRAARTGRRWCRRRRKSPDR